MSFSNSNSIKSKNLILFIFFILTTNFLLILNVIPQVTEEWVARYNGPGNGDDYAKAIALDSSGNVYVTGTSIGLVTDSDYVTIMYNSDGYLGWIARYDGWVGSDSAEAIAIDNTGNVYVTGTSYGLGTGSDYATIKYNNAGARQWVARYTCWGINSDDAKAIALDSSGNVYVTGTSYGSGTFRDYATIKYNSSGVEQWVARYNGSGNYYDEANAIAVDSSGNVYVTGESWGSREDSTSIDYATIKYNNSGIQQWVRKYNGPGNSYDYATAIALDSSGNVYVTGYSDGSGTYFGSDYATIKYNSSGAEQWVARYNGPGNSSDYARAIALDSSGNVYVTGSSYGSGTSFDYATIKYNSAGVEQWVAIYNGPGNSGDDANAIAIDSSGNVYVTGYSKDSENYTGYADEYATIKYNSAGVQQWVARYNRGLSYDEWAEAIAIDSSGNVYVTGTSYGSGTGLDYATIKYSQGTSIK